jgi:hypothetical protein
VVNYVFFLLLVGGVFYAMAIAQIWLMIAGKFGL